MKTKEPTDKNQDMAKFIEHKLQFIIKEYQGHQDTITRNISRITMLRSWEISLLSALTYFLISNNSEKVLVIIPISVIILFLFIECGIQSTIKRLTIDLHEIQKKLQTEDAVIFNKNILNWEFTAENEKWGKCDKIKYAFSAMKSLNIILWYIALFVLVLLVLFY